MRLMEIVCCVAVPAAEQLRRRLTDVMVAPAGMPLRSNLTTPRRMLPPALAAVRPARKNCDAPALSEPVEFSMMVLSATLVSVTVSATAEATASSAARRHGIFMGDRAPEGDKPRAGRIVPTACPLISALALNRAQRTAADRCAGNEPRCINAYPSSAYAPRVGHGFHIARMMPRSVAPTVPSLLKSPGPAVPHAESSSARSAAFTLPSPFRSCTADGV